MTPMPIGGGAPRPRFVPLLQTEQVGDLPLDPGGVADVGTGFSRTTGVFRWVLAASATLVNGQRKNQVAWTARILDIHPAYNPETDVLQTALIYDVPIALDAANPQYGVMSGIIDTAPANKATCNGLCHGIQNQSAAARQSVGVNGTTMGGTNTFSLTPYRAVSTFLRAGGVAPPSTRDMTGEYFLENTAHAFFNGGRTAGMVPLDDDFSLWRFVVGHTKNAAALATVDFSCRFFSRVIPLGGWFTGLP